MKFKEMDETHMEGLLTVEKSTVQGGSIVDLGIMIDATGRVWVCVNGEALIRFKPMKKEKPQKPEGGDE